MLDQDVARRKRSRAHLLAAHDLQRELALDRRLDGRDDRGGILTAPGRVLRMRLAIPLVEVDRSALLDEPTILVVDPVAREGAGAGEVVFGRSIRIDRECKSGPGDRRVDLEVRLSADPSRRGHAGTTAGGLREAHPVGPDLAVLERRHGDSRNGDFLRTQLQPRQSDPPAAGLPVVHDLAVLDLDPRLQLIRLAEEIGPVHQFQVVDAVRRGVVVVDHTHGEGQLR